MKDAKLAMVSVKASMWGARKKISTTEISGKLKEGESLPPDAIATAGSKAIFPKEYIGAVAQAKNRLLSWMAKNGIVTSSTTAVIPYALKAEFMDVAKECEEHFKAGVNKIINDYDYELSAYASKWPEWSDFILRSAMKKEQIQDKYSWKTRAQPYTTFEDDENSLHDELVSDLFVQMSEDMFDYFEKVITNDKITARGVGRLSDTIDKLKSFAFLSPKLMPLALFMEGKIKEARDLQDLTDPESPIAGQAKRIIEKMIIVMSNEKKLAIMAEELAKNAEYDAVGNLIDDSIIDLFAKADSVKAQEVNDNESKIVLRDDIVIVDDLSSENSSNIDLFVDEMQTSSYEII